MKQHVIAAAAAVTLAGAVSAAVIPLAQGATAAAGAAPAATTTLTFQGVTKSNVRVPKGGVEVDVIRKLSGTAIGAGSLVCHVINPKAPPKCAVSFNLPGGYLFFSVTGTKTGAAGPEVGGTGKYAHTTGNVVATDISQTKTKVVVTLHR
jgi:hypothetical protein